ncbi:siderophore-iron transporter Str1 [Turnera subulata]|uniref:Sulfurtransferase n=1 Tax=Turnera subulata TaxID=218843 RepID=A0A9Q0FEH9_9ROSI|nr:siderophore-iron transporter Str1 [Turnera subulata]
MASTIFRSALLGSHRLVHSSPALSHRTKLVSCLFSRKEFHARAAHTSYRTFCRVPPVMASSVVGTKVNFSTQTLSTNEPVVSVDWLHANLREPDMKVLDASWYMPAEQRNPIQEYQVAHIPGALFFDVDGISDRTTSFPAFCLRHLSKEDYLYQLPHMLPSEEAFAAAVSALGIENKDGLVVYDGKGIFSAARVWWMFRVFGHDRVWVLDGGLPRWRASGYDVESSASGDAILKASAASEAIEKVYQGQAVQPITFQTKFQPHLIWTLEQVKENIENKTYQHIDARSKDRFDGTAPEPRKGIRSGHVPGSKCIPFGQMLDSSQTLLPAEELKKQFDQQDSLTDTMGVNLVKMSIVIRPLLYDRSYHFVTGNHDDAFCDLTSYVAAGISLESPVVTSCGTGVTAAILALGLHRLGKTDVAVYDGSWTEWGGHPDTPVDASDAQ